MTLRCTRCNRRMKRPTETGLGPTCQVYVLGRKPRPAPREDRRSADERQRELFA